MVAVCRSEKNLTPLAVWIKYRSVCNSRTDRHLPIRLVYCAYAVTNEELNIARTSLKAVKPPAEIDPTKQRQLAYARE